VTDDEALREGLLEDCPSCGAEHTAGSLRYGADGNTRCPECDGDGDGARVMIWRGRNAEFEADYPGEIVAVPEDQPHVYAADPRFHGVFGFSIKPVDRPATLNIWTNDSVRDPPTDSPAEWDGPVEKGLDYGDDTDIDPFGCELWGRVMFTVETRH
jgi:hypothetical protein